MTISFVEKEVRFKVRYEWMDDLIGFSGRLGRERQEDPLASLVWQQLKQKPLRSQ